MEPVKDDKTTKASVGDYQHFVATPVWIDFQDILNQGIEEAIEEMATTDNLLSMGQAQGKLRSCKILLDFPDQVFRQDKMIKEHNELVSKNGTNDKSV